MDFYKIDFAVRHNRRLFVIHWRYSQAQWSVRIDERKSNKYILCTVVNGKNPTIKESERLLRSYLDDEQRFGNAIII